MENAFVPSIALSIVDFIPTILYLIGSFFVVRYAYRNTHIVFCLLILLGALIVSAGGFINATCMLFLATTGNNFATLGDKAIYYLTSGSVLIFIGVISVFTKHNSRRYNTFYVVPFYLPLIATLTVATVGYLALLATISFEKKLIKSCISFIIYMIICLILARMSSLRDELWKQWVTLSVNIIGSSMLIYGAYALDKYDKEHPVILNK